MASFKDFPLVYRMASAVRPTLTSNEAGNSAILRGLRQYTATSLVNAALRMLWAKCPTMVDELQTAPWHILLLVKWSFRDPHVALRAGTPITAAEFDGLRQQVAEEQRVAYVKHSAKDRVRWMTTRTSRNLSSESELSERRHRQPIDCQ